MILLDTNVVSEVMRPRPDSVVENWLDRQPPEELWTAAVVLAELFGGIEVMPLGRKQLDLRKIVEEMIAEDFQGRILLLDLAVARCYGQILSARRRIGRPIREMDALIAATALANGAALATRNTSDFEDCGIQMVNPWNQA